jgi:CRP-like cAMP-binding protein
MTQRSELTNDLYAGLSAEVRQELAKHEQIMTAAAGTSLVQCGSCPDQLMFLNSGSAETSVKVAGKNMSLGIATPGKVFGLHAIISGAPPDMSVTCLEECEITFLPKTAFLDVLQRNPQMYFAVVKVLSSDLAAADRIIRTYARRSSAKTLAKCFRPA